MTQSEGPSWLPSGRALQSPPLFRPGGGAAMFQASALEAGAERGVSHPGLGEEGGLNAQDRPLPLSWARKTLMGGGGGL